MKAKRYILCVLGFATSLVCHQAMAAGMKEMLGNWYAEVRENSTFQGKRYTLRQQIELNRPDGTKIVMFRYYAGNLQIGESVITFAWGAADNVHWAVCQTEVTNGHVTPCSWRTEYDILSANEHELRYRGRQFGTIYSLTRVSDDFLLP
jgi:hypothetical protein